MPVWLPVTVDFEVSVAVTDCVAAVFSTTPLVKMWIPWSQPVVQFGVAAEEDLNV